MLKEKVIEWIGKTFGEHRVGDRFELSNTISEKNDKGMMVMIEELNFVFQRRKTEVTEKEIRQWKQELDDLSTNSLRGFHFEKGDLIGMATPQDIQKGVPAGTLVTGSSLLLSVGIFKKKFLAKSVLFPSKMNSSRRH